jgi:hypothetical protein
VTVGSNRQSPISDPINVPRPQSRLVPPQNPVEFFEGNSDDDVGNDSRWNNAEYGKGTEAMTAFIHEKMIMKNWSKEQLEESRNPGTPEYKLRDRVERQTKGGRNG